MAVGSEPSIGRSTILPTGRLGQKHRTLRFHTWPQFWAALYVCMGCERERKKERYIIPSFKTKQKRFRIFIVRKEANFDLWDQESIHVFFICVSFLRKCIHTLTHIVRERQRHKQNSAKVTSHHIRHLNWCVGWH
mgnify:CR=1 FL=1